MSEQFPKVTLPNTEVRTLRSVNVDQEYKLFVSLPDDYHQSEEKYPVIYVGDGNRIFSFFASERFKWLPIPPMIIVGIGYPTDENADIFSLRAQDFLPTRDEKRQQLIKDSSQRTIEPGGGPQFLKFIRDELFDFVDSQYRTNPGDRTFYGFSWGGTFGIYMLFNQPDMFQRYIIGAPDLSWDNQICFTYENDYAKKHSELPVKLYLAVGTLDEDLIEHNFSLLVQFHTMVQSRSYKGLEMHFEIYAGENHISAIVPTASRGIRALFG